MFWNPWVIRDPTDSAEEKFTGKWAEFQLQDRRAIFSRTISFTDKFFIDNPIIVTVVTFEQMNSVNFKDSHKINASSLTIVWFQAI